MSLSHCHCGDRIKPTQTSSQIDCLMKAVAGMAAMCWEHGAVEPPWFQALIEMQAEVQRIVAPAWQGLSAMPDSAYSPLPPLVPDKAGGRRSNIIVDFIWGGGLRDFRAHLCYWHFLMCLCKQIFQQKRRQENSAPTYHVWWQVHIMGTAASVSILDQYGPIMTAARLCTRGVLIFRLLYKHICVIRAFLNTNLISILYLYTNIIFIGLIDIYLSMCT